LLFSTLPPTPGSYVLLLRLDAPLAVRAGRLGEVVFAPGAYAYTGSALGPGGLRGRVGRHLRAEKRPHWHIDALTAAAPVVAVWAAESPARLECAWAAALTGLPASAIPARGFGASDCACSAHLIRIATPEAIPAALQATLPPGVLLYFPQPSVV
jgi:Uri superfamily endonuclease